MKFKIAELSFLTVCRFTLATNDRGYGHGRFAGAFAVAQRQSECGRKDCQKHISRPKRIGVC